MLYLFVNINNNTAHYNRTDQSANVENPKTMYKYLTKPIDIVLVNNPEYLIIFASLNILRFAHFPWKSSLFSRSVYLVRFTTNLQNN